VMKHNEGNLKEKGAFNNYYQYWQPDTESKAIMLVVHGLAEHSGRYMNVVNHFVPLGYAVYGIDHIGHGKTEGDRLCLNRFEDFIRPLSVYLAWIKKENPDKPVILVGHSMGGLIASIFLLDHQDEFKTAVISAPLIKSSGEISSVSLFIVQVLSAILPKTGVMSIDGTAVSRDPDVVKAYNEDPLVHRGKASARLMRELILGMRRINVDATKINLPILILQGDQDKIVSPEGARILHDLVSSSDKTIKIYEGLYHEIFNEPEHGQVLGDVSDWLKSRID
jgi:acylglycerol lipase